MRVPEQIGGFEILGVIASGGMGTVYEALQEQPRRTVAVKVMRWDLSSREALRRFDYETRLLARLRHPGIAQVYDAGVHDEDGLRLPYFAMELVPSARSITRYADEERLGLKERLELFARLCDAVEHAHQKGVIHRDLKPTNVLVGDDGDARVIDFGVARSTDADVTLASLRTEAGRLIGTLQYMSPEQCTGGGELVDTRSDVYSLGVVLYELLSGRRPYDVGGLSVYEATRTVIESRPASLGAADRRLRGEVETIVGRALEKDRARRYGTAGELAADVRRYLAGEAITARPPNALYQLRVFARRNKSLVAAVACVLLALVAGLISTNAALVKAERALEESDQVSRLLSDAFLRVNPANAGGKEPLVREAFEELSAQLASGAVDFPKDSLREAELCSLVGRIHYSLKDFKRAKPHLERCLEIRRRRLGQDTKVAEAMFSLAMCLEYLRDADASAALTEQIIAMHETGKIPQSVVVASAYADRGWRQMGAGRYEEAKATYEHALHMLHQEQDHVSQKTVRMTTALGRVYWHVKDFGRAKELLEEALRMCDTLGPDLPARDWTYKCLSELAQRMGDRDKQVFYARQRWQHFKRLYARDLKRIFSEDSRDVFVFRFFDYVHTLEKVSDLEASLPLLKEAEDALRSALESSELSPEHLRWCRCLLGKCLGRQERFEEGHEVLTELYRELLERDVESEKWLMARTARELVFLTMAWGRPEEVAEWRRRLDDVYDDPAAPGRNAYDIGAQLAVWGQFSEAEMALREAMQQYEQLDPDTKNWTRCRLSRCLRERGEYEEAERLLMNLFDEASAQDDDRWTAKACRRLALLYLAQQRPEVAARWRLRAVVTEPRPMLVSQR